MPISKRIVAMMPEKIALHQRGDKERGARFCQNCTVKGIERRYREQVQDAESRMGGVGVLKQRAYMYIYTHCPTSHRWQHARQR